METGISDHYALIVSFLKLCLQKCDQTKYNTEAKIRTKRSGGL